MVTNWLFYLRFNALIDRISRPEISANALYILISMEVNLLPPVLKVVLTFYASFKVNYIKAICEWICVISWHVVPLRAAEAYGGVKAQIGSFLSRN
jgi:hypothetical protein